MGYNIRLVGCDFWISAGYTKIALEHLRRRTDPDSLAYMNRATPEEWDYLKEALRDWRFKAELDNEQNIVGLQFIGEKAGPEKILFDVLAPYVKEGSYVEFVGEDGIRCKYTFTGGDVNRDLERFSSD